MIFLKKVISSIWYHWGRQGGYVSYRSYWFGKSFCWFSLQWCRWSVSCLLSFCTATERPLLTGKCSLSLQQVALSKQLLHVSFSEEPVLCRTSHTHEQATGRWPPQNKDMKWAHGGTPWLLHLINVLFLLTARRRSSWGHCIHTNTNNECNSC